MMHDQLTENGGEGKVFVASAKYHRETGWKRNRVQRKQTVLWIKKDDGYENFTHLGIWDESENEKDKGKCNAQ